MDLTLGRRVTAMVMRHLEILLQEGGHDGDEALMTAAHTSVGDRAPAVTVGDDEDMVMVFFSCCHPTPGDPIIGYISKDEDL